MKTFNCVLALVLLFLPGASLWAIPAGFNIQGRLTDANGINKNETIQIKFSVFATVDSMTPVWETLPSMDVHVQNGNFQVVLQGADLENAIKDLETAYVEIKVGSDAPLTPRQQLLRSPFSSADKFVGAVMFFAGATCPDGWLLANGAILPTIGADAKKYTDLANYLGHTYDPVQATVMLPNMIDGSFIRATGGNAANLGVRQDDAIIAHTHTTSSLGPYRDYGPGNYGLNNYAPGNVPTNSQQPPGASETRPLNYAMTPCIKY